SVYRVPLSTPRNGSSKGSALSASSEPPGRRGAIFSSQSRHKTIRAISDAEAPWRSTGFNCVVILVLSLESHLYLPWNEKVFIRPMQTKNARPKVTLSTLRKIARFVLQRAAEKKLTQVASSLTFTTVLSIVPLLAVVLSLFTAFPLFNDFRIALENFLTNSLMPPSVSDNVMLYLNQFAAKASGLTAVGSLFLIVTSVSLFMTIDQTLNNIW